MGVSIEKKGEFYLGKGVSDDKPLQYESKNLTTHAICVGMTGSGKTGLGVVVLEEAAMDGIPAIIIDPKGDLGNLLLTFPHLLPEDFLPWIDEGEASRKELSLNDYAAQVATAWRNGISAWEQNPERIEKLRNAVDFSIYTPASTAGIPLAILTSFDAPSPELMQDAEAYRDHILSTVSGLLGLLGIDADPIKSREHILISTILDQAWREQKNLDLPSLIQQVQSPPFAKVGVFDIETYFPSKERSALALHLNHLLSSPSFQAWMEGEPLNIDHLLYTKEGKPRHSIIYIAHLSDNERMFFVTLLLNAMVSWVRRQSGTSSLRALLYMDEIFGFFPPTSVPSSKIPMLTLLKQARAYGLGIVLCTQNPVDLDYKGLSNCGTWFIGKLQTERDKSRLLDGLEMASTGESTMETLDQMLSSVVNRTFILRSIYQPNPFLFQTRWTLCYLRGPLTLPQIQLLMQPKKREAPSPLVATSKKPIETKPLLGGDIPEYFIPQPKGSQSPYHPSLIGIAKLHFVDAKNKIDTWEERIYLAEAINSGQEAAWEQTDIQNKLKREAPSEASFQELPLGLAQEKNYSIFRKSLAAFLYQTASLNLLSAAELKLSSKIDESEEEFKNRINQALNQLREEELTKIKQKYQSKIAALTEKVRRAQEKVEKRKSQVWRRWLETILSIATTVLGAFIGRKKISSTTINQAGTSIKRAERIGKEHQDTANAEEELSIYQQQLEDLQKELQIQSDALISQFDLSKVQIEKLSIHPRKSDIEIVSLGLLWS